MKYSVISGACTYVCAVPIIQWLCGSVSSVQCTVCVCSVHMFVCVVFTSMKLLHTPVLVVMGSSLSSRDCSKLFSIPHRIRQCSSPTNEVYSAHPPHL